MNYYHGSIVPNLKELLPFNMPHGNAKKQCVYLTSNKPLTTLYLWVRKFMWLTYHFNDDNVIVYTECFKNQLEEFYKDVRGYIYTCDIENEGDDDTGIKSAISVTRKMQVTGCEIVEDAYNKILEHEKRGEIIIRRYHELTEKEHTSNKKMIVGAIKRLDLLSCLHPLSAFVQDKFPDIWDECKE